MNTVTEQDYEALLRDLLLQSLDPAWTNVVMNWIKRFDGWYLQEREVDRNPQAAIAYNCLRRQPIRRGVARTTRHLAYLPFNRWTAVAVFTQVHWNPLEENFATFLMRNKQDGVFAFAIPEVTPRRMHNTIAYLRTMYELELIQQKVSGLGTPQDD